jgi:hypothetical protein
MNQEDYPRAEELFQEVIVRGDLVTTSLVYLSAFDNWADVLCRQGMFA